MTVDLEHFDGSAVWLLEVLCLFLSEFALGVDSLEDL